MPLSQPASHCAPTQQLASAVIKINWVPQVMLTQSISELPAQCAESQLISRYICEANGYYSGL